MFQITLWSIPPLLAALVCVGAYLRARKMKRVPGMQALLALLAALLFWSGAQFIGSIFTVPSIKLLTAKLAYFGIVLTPVAWLFFAVGYTRRQMRLPRLALNLILIVIPPVTLVLVMTNDWHHLIWHQVEFVRDQGVYGMITEYGPWFYVHAFYSYGMLVVATTILAWSIGHTTGAWKPVVAVIAAPVVVALTNLFYLSPLQPGPLVRPHHGGLRHRRHDSGRRRASLRGAGDDSGGSRPGGRAAPGWRNRAERRRHGRGHQRIRPSGACEPSEVRAGHSVPSPASSQNSAWQS